MAVLQVPGYPGHTSGPVGTVTRLVLHATVSPCVVGGARGVASYFQRSSAGGLAHYVVDPSEVVQCAPETLATWGAPPNSHSLHIELCDPQTGDPARWGDANHQAMLALAAPLIRDVCQRHNLPTVYVNAAGLLAGMRGITTHADVSAAWHQTDHTDPGSGFPMTAFLAAVNAPVSSHVVTPPVTPPPLEETTMFVFTTPSGAIYLAGATSEPVWITKTDDVNALFKAGVKDAGKLSADTCKALGADK